MSQHTVITEGFGTFGSTSFVITDGYSSGEATPFPLCITLSQEVEYGITIGKSTEYGITIGKSTEYGITTAHGGCQ